MAGWWDDKRRMLLEEAVLIAIKAHRGQRDKGGAPYVLHPLRVMLQLGDLREMMPGSCTTRWRTVG